MSKTKKTLAWMASSGLVGLCVLGLEGLAIGVLAGFVFASISIDLGGN